jgi:uncharacterized protein
MATIRFLSAAFFSAISILAAGGLQAADQPGAEATAKMRVLVVVGGHGFAVEPFQAIFKNFADMQCTFVEEKQGGEAFENIDNWPYDAIVLYNFEKKPSKRQRNNLLTLMDRGVGLVVLHHAIHAYRSWPEFKKIAGISSFVDVAKDDVNFTVHIEDPKHPIVKGMKDFAVKDETYSSNHATADVHVILSTDEPGNARAVAWVHTYRKSPVCYLQLGHGPSVYGQRQFLDVLGNAIRWVAGRLKEVG